MRLLNKHAHLADANRAGAHIEAGEVKVFPLLLHDLNNDVLSISQEEPCVQGVQGSLLRGLAEQADYIS